MRAKEQIRKKISARLEALGAPERARKSALASARLVSNLLQRMPDLSLVCCYLSFGTEASCDELFLWAHEKGIQLAFPRITTIREPMEFIIADPGHSASFEMHRYGLRQPRAGLTGVDWSTFSPQQAALVVPAVAFDLSCNRLGRGGGFYDRFLTRYGTRLSSIGFAFEEQIVESLETEEHDQRVECVITDERTYLP